jgi:hypothetical protein
VAKIQQWATETGREGDLRILSPDSESYYEFLARLQSLSGLDEAVDEILSAAPREDSENGYWRHPATQPDPWDVVAQGGRANQPCGSPISPSFS